MNRGRSDLKYKNRNISVALTRKYRNKDDETAPIFWRITFNRKMKHISTGFELSSDEWKDFVERDLKKHKSIKQTLKGYLRLTLIPEIDKLAETNSFSFEALNNSIINTGKTSVNNAFHVTIENLGIDNKVGTESIYKSTLKALMKFKHYKLLRNEVDRQKFIDLCIERKNITVGEKVLNIVEEINFEEITPKFLEECERFWYKIELSTTSVGIYMRHFKAIINNGEKGKPYLKENNYPFGAKQGKYKIPYGGRRDIALTIEQIWKIENFETNIESLAIARDIFVFMFYCNGLNFSDLCRLRFENIDAPNKEIVFQRKKTDRKNSIPTFIYVPIIPPMVDIINSRGNKNQDGYIFPFLNGIEPIEKNERKIITRMRLELDPINSSLKYIANELELDPELTTSYTRNSYITHLTSELLVNPIVVKKMVGHSTKKDVTAGYVKLTAKKRREINMKLVNPEREYRTIRKKALIS